jgi:hypothetical protein
MDKIHFDIESNFVLYINESIEQLVMAIEENEPKHYNFSSIFSGIAIELGLALIVGQGMKKNIYLPDNKTFKYPKIEELFKDGLNDYVRELFKGYAHKEYDPKNNDPTNISIKVEILENEVMNIKNARNDLVHNKGTIAPEEIESFIFNSLLFLNVLLPEQNKFYKILNEKAIGLYLEKSITEEILFKVSNAFQIFQYRDDEHYNSSIEDEIYDCVDCNHPSMINISGHTNSRPGYLCLVCMSHGYLKGCSQCSKWIKHGEEIDWNNETSAYVCEECNDRFTYLLQKND